jgi:single-stranded DNA-binding protein
MAILWCGRRAPGFVVIGVHCLGQSQPRQTGFQSGVTWDRLAETCGRYLGKGQEVAIEGRIQTRTWDDDQGNRDRRSRLAGQ